jgi:hypothetical protein
MKMLFRLTGGRPMRRRGYAFTDVITGRPISYFTDKFERLWLAEGPWSLFRVASDVGEELR